MPESSAKILSLPISKQYKVNVSRRGNKFWRETFNKVSLKAFPPPSPADVPTHFMPKRAISAQETPASEQGQTAPCIVGLCLAGAAP